MKDRKKLKEYSRNRAIDTRRPPCICL